jgi:hypothetical protein
MVTRLLCLVGILPDPQVVPHSESDPSPLVTREELARLFHDELSS